MCIVTSLKVYTCMLIFLRYQILGADTWFLWNKPNYKWHSTWPWWRIAQTKIFTYNIYITIYTIYIRGKVSMYITCVCVWDVSFVIDYLLLRGALYLTQNRREIFHKAFQLVLIKALNSISYCYGINVLPLVWITWENSNMNIDTIEPLVIEKLMQVLTVIVQNTASGNNIAGVFNI